MNKAMASISHLVAGWPYFPQASQADSNRGLVGERDRRDVGFGADRRCDGVVRVVLATKPWMCVGWDGVGRAGWLEVSLVIDEVGLRRDDG